MTDPLRTVSTVLEIAHKLRDLAQKIKDADTKNLIADLNLQLVDLKMDVAALREENLSLRAELRAAQESQDQRSNLEHRENVYFLREPGNRHAGPYCPRCYDVEQRLVTVATLPPEFQDMATYRCSHCKGTY